MNEFFSDEDIKEAVSLKCANTYASLSIANALSGQQSKAWKLCHTYTLREILSMVNDRQIILDGLLSAMDKIPVQESLYYKRATGIMNEEEFNTAFRRWQRGK